MLTERLWRALRDVAESDIEGDYPEIRAKPLAEVQEVIAAARAASYDPDELYRFVVGMEEGQGELELEKDSGIHLMD